MIVYVESNFIFELGLGREEQGACRTLLEWCESGRIELRLPAYAITETRRALRVRDKNRLETVRMLETQRDDAKRHSAAVAPTLEAAQQSLRLWTVREAEHIGNLLQRVLYGRVTLISLDRESLGHEDALRVVNLLSGDGDLLIFSCILGDLVHRNSAGDALPSLFVTRDKDFGSMRTMLHPYSCDLLTSYSAAVERLKGQFP